jgi:hypothetical protein
MSVERAGDQRAETHPGQCSHTHETKDMNKHAMSRDRKLRGRSVRQFAPTLEFNCLESRVVLAQVFTALSSYFDVDVSYFGSSSYNRVMEAPDDGWTRGEAKLVHQKEIVRTEKASATPYVSTMCQTDASVTADKNLADTFHFKTDVKYVEKSDRRNQDGWWVQYTDSVIYTRVMFKIGN